MVAGANLAICLHVPAVVAAGIAPQEMSRAVWGADGLALVAVLAVVAAAALVALRPAAWWTPGRLRAAEAALFGGSLLFLARWQFGQLVIAGDAAAVRYAGVNAIPAWSVTILIYGTFIPSGRARTAVTCGAMAAAALGTTAVTAATSDPVRPEAGMLLTKMAAFLLPCLAVAVAATRQFQTLRTAVAEARREVREVGTYRLIRKLGEGGMGEVYLAEHRGLKQPCAVKVMRPGGVTPDAARRFEREAKVTAGLRHPNVVALYDYGQTADGVIFCAMEYLPGPSLEEAVRRNGPAPPALAAHVLRQLCGALECAHRAGLVHRDLKPANVILLRGGDPPDVVKLLDFGLAHREALDADAAKLTQTGMVVGTPQYMSPEQAEGGSGVGPGSDVYSLGATAYYLLTGRPPFVRESVGRLIMAHIADTPVPVGRLNSDVPAGLDAVVMRCLRKAPADRYPTAAAVAAALADVPLPAWTADDGRAWWQWAAAPAGPAELSDSTVTVALS